MTKFLDGPAAGQTLMLKRTPMFLRVVRDAQGKWDALDQPEDTPAAGETIFVYLCREFRGQCHVKMGGASKNASGFYRMADYDLCPEQPTQEVLRDADQWHTFCVQHSPFYFGHEGKRI